MIAEQKQNVHILLMSTVSVVQLMMTFCCFPQSVNPHAN